RLENSTPSNIKPATVVSASGALLAHDTECPALTIGRWNGSQWLAARITLHRLTNQRPSRNAEVFAMSSSARPSTPEVDIKALHAKIGELTLENDFLESALDKAGLLSARR